MNTRLLLELEKMIGIFADNNGSEEWFPVLEWTSQTDHFLALALYAQIMNLSVTSKALEDKTGG